MRKSTKLAILVAALVALCSIAALAADTWKQEGDQWFCYDKDGNPYYGAWKKSGANWYYLDDATGAMVTNQLVETDGETYWCGEDGARVLQTWVQVPVENDDDGFEWMFFKALTGKAIKWDSKATPANAPVSVKTADGVSKKYVFDENGYMMYGYLVDLNGSKANNVVDANYYYGPKEEGWQRTEWQKFVDGELPEYEDSELVYFYFKNSKKVTATDHVDGQYKVSAGKYYQFALDGKLLTGWQRDATTLEWSYLGAADDGLVKKKAWFKTDKVDGTEGWVYLGSNGNPTCGGVGADNNSYIKKINGKYYLFNNKGRMLTGAVIITTKDDLDPTADGQVLKQEKFKSASAYKSVDFDYAAGDRIYYFSTDADNDGSMKTGVQTFVIEDDEVTAYFDKHGVAFEGIVSKKIYNRGILQAAGDAKYAIAELQTPATGEDDYYLVNAAGSILSNAKVCDADGIWWIVTDKNAIYKFADRDYAATAATKWKASEETFKIGDTTYQMYVDATKKGDGYEYVTWKALPKTK